MKFHSGSRTFLALALGGALAAAEPIVVFSPKCQFGNEHPNGVAIDGSLDFMSLFKADAPWKQAAGHVQIFKFSPRFIDRATDEELKTAIDDLARRGIGLGLATGGLTATDTYGKGVEGFGGPKSLTRIERIKSLGGDLGYINLDEPYTFGCRYNGPNAAHLKPEEVAHEIAEFIAKVHAIFPKAVVGDAEAIGFSGIGPADIEQWLTTYRDVTGAPFPFYLCDTGWWRPTAFAEMREMQAWVQAHDMQFGTYYDGDADDTSDAAWMEHAEEAFCRYERAGERRPDQVQMQSWNDRPHYTLPESDPTRHTAILLSYARAITDLQLKAGPGRSGWTIAGRLLTEDGKPVAHATVSLSRQARSGPGETGTYQITGEVPAWATTATILVAANGDGATPGPIDATIARIRWFDTADHVANGDFAAGLAEWHASGEGIDGSSAPNAGAHLHLDAAHSAKMTSERFAVKGGTPYEFGIDARIAPSASGHGYFAVVFSSDGHGEGLRQKLWFAPACVPIGTVTTDDQGGFSLSVEQQRGAYDLIARFAGDSARRMTMNSVAVEDSAGASGGSAR
jgi:hypothetical protein